MKIDYEEKYHRLEVDNWWFLSRRELIYKLIDKVSNNRNSKILEIGSSGGYLLMLLNNNGYVNSYGIDISKKAIDQCKQKGIENAFVMDGIKTQFRNEEFDIIVASDVLEHIKEPKTALAEWERILKPNGKLIIFVPAFNFLWSSHDVVNFHYRRYSKIQLRNELEKSGFFINQASYWNFSLFIPIAIFRILSNVFNKHKITDQFDGTSHVINKAFLTLLRFENWLIDFLNFPVGVSLFAICTK